VARSHPRDASSTKLFVNASAGLTRAAFVTTVLSNDDSTLTIVSSPASGTRPSGENISRFSLSEAAYSARSDCENRSGIFAAICSAGCVLIQCSALTEAVASAWMVLGFFSMKAGVA